MNGPPAGPTTTPGGRAPRGGAPTTSALSSREDVSEPAAVPAPSAQQAASPLTERRMVRSKEMSTTLAEREAEALLERLFAPETRPDPYPVLRELRAESPVVTKAGDLVVVARYADCRQVLRDPSVKNDPKLSRLGKDYPVRQESLLF